MDRASAQSYLQSHYQFKFNTVKGIVECYPLRGYAEKQILDDRLLNDLWFEVNTGEGPTLSFTKLKRLLHSSSLAEPYDPFLDYLEGLPAWTPDAQDFIAQLAGSITTDEPELLSLYLRKWLVAMVASLFSDEIVNHTALIISGAQGIGKTRWLDTLIPSALRDYCYLGPLPATAELDLLLTSSFLINLDELAGCTAARLAQLKTAITKGFVNKLVPYQRYYQRLPRRATFAGTVNGGEFLHDETGNRRFLVVEAEAIEVDHGIDPDMIYAQAFHLFLTGHQFWFDKEEIARINQANVNHQNWTLEELALLEVYEPGDEHNYTDMATTTEILETLAMHPADLNIRVTNPSLKAVGKALRKHDFPRVKRKGRYQYLLKAK